MMLDLFSFDLLSASWLDIQGMLQSVYLSHSTPVWTISQTYAGSGGWLTYFADYCLADAADSPGIKLDIKGASHFSSKRCGERRADYGLEIATMTSMDAGDKELQQASKQTIG